MGPRKKLRKTALLMSFGLLISGGATGLYPAYAAAGGEQPAAQAAQEANVYQGKVTGVSKKAKSIALSVGKGDQATVRMVKFDAATKGLEHAKEGESAIITFALRGKDAFAMDIKPKLATLPAGVKEIQPEELIPLVDAGFKKGGVVLIDSRPAKPYANGHIPGAISIPADDIKAKGAALLPADKKTPLIFYCGGVTCGLSPASAKAAKEMGYTDIRVLLKGAPGWKQAGKVLVASDGFVDQGNIILVDLRGEAETQSGHISRAVNIPFASLTEAEADIPAKAPVVLYGKTDEVAKAAKMIAKWGVKAVAMVDGGLEGYVARHHQLASGPMATEIEWVRQLGKDEVGAEEFLAAASGKSVSTVILDVRTADESAEGSFAKALTIPLDALEARVGELPKEKEILIHCSTGARAEMAQQLLAKQGLKSRFLVADVACDGPGQCSVD